MELSKIDLQVDQVGSSSSFNTDASQCSSTSTFFSTSLGKRRKLSEEDRLQRWYKRNW